MSPLSTKRIHNPISRWFGDFVFSKSCENSIVCWKPGGLGEGEERREGERGEQGRTTVIQKMEVKDCEIWFIRFSTDCEDKVGQWCS